MKVIAQQQVAETLIGETNLTLKYDGTTTPVGHLVATEIATAKEILLVGLSQQEGVTADEYCDSITQEVIQKHRQQCVALVNYPMILSTTKLLDCILKHR